MAVQVPNMANNAADTYTLEDFISMGADDNLQYHQFITKYYRYGMEFLKYNILDFYLKELKKLCVKVNTISNEEKVKYMYAPHILSYDLYGTTNLDFIILLCNNMISPNEFNFKKKYLYLPKPEELKYFLSEVYNANTILFENAEEEFEKERDNYYS